MNESRNGFGSDEISRRGFLKLLGTAVGGAALKKVGIRVPPPVEKPHEMGQPPAPANERWLTDDRLREKGVKVKEFEFEWELDESTRERLTPAEREGSQQPKLEQLIGPNGEVVGYKMTWYPDNILGANGASIYITDTDGETSIVDKVVGVEWFSENVDPKITETMGSEAYPLAFSVYIINKSLGLSGPNVVTSQVPLKNGRRLIVRSFSGVYEVGKWGNLYFNEKTVKRIEAELPAPGLRDGHDKLDNQAKG